MSGICIVTSFDPGDKRSWSGALTMMIAELEKLGPVLVVRTPGKTALVDRFFAKYARYIFWGKKYLWNFGIATAITRSHLLRKKLQALDFDIVLSIASSVEVSFLKNKSFRKPIVLVGDASFKQLVDFYPDFTNLSWLSRVQGEVLARKIANKADLFVMPSRWAIDSLMTDYKVNEDSCIKSDFGASRHRENDFAKLRTDNLRFLFLASDWSRKNGDKVVELLAEIRAIHKNVELTVIGDYPLGLPEWISCSPRLPVESLPDVFESHDVLIDLAVANAFSLAVIDALAMGLPVITNRIGGTAEIVSHEVNGFLVDEHKDLTAQVLDWTIQLSDDETYRRISNAALASAAETFSWARWAKLTWAACERASQQGVNQ